MNESPLVNPDIDYSQAPPIQQKRIIAFINHFIINTVSFLNAFAKSCESKLMDVDFKLQKVESALIILESQLSSISDENFISLENITLPEICTVVESKCEQDQNETSEESSKVEDIKLNEDPVYSKYFKMVQVGVPIPAVKLKMKSEGLDDSILDRC